ncbi:MAG: PilW family protein [Candidatus Sumerlaeia bacterium]
MLFTRNHQTGKSRGFTLVEVLFAVVISALVAGGLMLLFISMSRVNRTNQATSLMRQEARTIMDRIMYQLRSAARDGNVMLMDAESATDYEGKVIQIRHEDIDTGAITVSEIRFTSEDKLELQTDIDDSTTIEILSEPPVDGGHSIRPSVEDCTFTILSDSNDGNRPVFSGVRIELLLSDRGDTSMSWQDGDAINELLVTRYITLRAP